MSATCSSCHGTNGVSAGGAIAGLAGLNRDYFIIQMKSFKEGKREATLMHQLSGSLRVDDVLAGLIKSFFFGAVVAGVGCLRGLQTGAGAAAVGDSTTRSVVTAIFLIVLLDAVFAVIYYQLKF